MIYVQERTKRNNPESRLDVHLERDQARLVLRL